MKKKAKIFSPDDIKTQVCQAVYRDMGIPSHVYGVPNGVFATLRYRQRFEMEKKYVSLDSQDEARGLLALLKFMQVNIHMRSYDKEGLDLPSLDQICPQSRYSAMHNILLRARAICRFVLTPFTEDEWFLATKHGTGSSIGVVYTDTSLEAKSKLPITLTENAVLPFTRYLDFDSQLKSAIIAYNSETPIGAWYEIVEGSRATTVPKSQTIDRLIAVEPTGNMFLQQGLMTMMYARLKLAGLDLETLPTQHRERARIASITSREATIDWSSASDCVSFELLRWLIPPMWFDCCNMVRSPKILIEDEYVDLAMFSTMGNAVTFPLETLVFWSLAHATRLETLGTLSHFPEWKDRHLCSVFGDDCIVPTEISGDFIEVMQSVGFLINKEKSFIGEEGFRESCGGDYLRGYDNRPFYIKAPTSTRLSALEPWLYIIGNRLMSKYMVCFGKRNYLYGKEFFETFFGLFRRYRLKPKVVPPDYPDDAGLKISDDLERFDANYRPNWSRVSVNQHGSYTFLYSHFRYRLDTRAFEELHYCRWLKQRVAGEVLPVSREEQLLRCHYLRRTSFVQDRDSREQLSPDVTQERSPWSQRRVNGGYVVSRGHTGHWSVPVLRRRQQ